MFCKSILYTILVTALTLLLIACDSSDQPATTSFRSSSPPPEPAPKAIVETVSSILVTSLDNGTDECSVAESTVSGGTPVAISLEDPNGSGKYLFDPVDFTFDVGETIEFTLTSETEFHTFTVCDLEIDQSVEPGQATTFSFTFDTAGTYELICTPHESLGMVGKIIIE